MKKEIKKVEKAIIKEWKAVHQLFDFAIVGLVGTLIQLIVLYLLTNYLNIYYLISGIIAFFVATMYSFLANKHFTFHSKIGFIICEERFFFVSFLCLFLNAGLLYLFTSIFHLYYILSQFLAGQVIFISTFFIHKHWTFQK